MTIMLMPTWHRKAVRSCDNDDVVQQMRIWYDTQRSCHHLRLWPSDQQHCGLVGRPRSTRTRDPSSHPRTGSCGPYNIIITVTIIIINSYHDRSTWKSNKMLSYRRETLVLAESGRLELRDNILLIL